MRKSLLLPLTVLAGAVFSATGLAQVDADPNKDYQICPEAGPWLICATSYVGPKSPQLAHEMILEIRTRFKMPAYVLSRGQEERRKQDEEFNRLKELYPEAIIPRRRGIRIQDECAVLVGGYRDQEAAYQALKDFKKLPSPSSERLCPIITQVGVPETPDADQKSEVHYAYANPFVTAFVVHNPTIPIERKKDAQNDKFLKKLNSGESYSLLKCPKQYTLMVAAFQGLHSIQGKSPTAANQSLFEKIFGNSTGEMLDASAQNAHNLADALHKAGGFEAYVLHMREGSVVTVGGFDREDDPQIKTIEQCLATRFKYERGVQLLPQPVVMQIPRP